MAAYFASSASISTHAWFWSRYARAFISLSGSLSLLFTSVLSPAWATWVYFQLDFFPFRECLLSCCSDPFGYLLRLTLQDVVVNLLIAWLLKSFFIPGSSPRIVKRFSSTCLLGGLHRHCIFQSCWVDWVLLHVLFFFQQCHDDVSCDHSLYQLICMHWPHCKERLYLPCDWWYGQS